MDIMTTILLCVASFVVAAVIAGIIAFKIGVSYRKKVAEAEIGSAEDEAKKIINDAVKTAETKKKEVLIEAKDEAHKLRLEADKDIKERRTEVSRQERRLQQKEENLDKKLDNLEKKEEQLHNKVKEAEEKLEEVNIIKKNQLDQLERISGLTVDQAKQQLLDSLDSELVHEKAMKLASYEQQLKDEADEKARQYISLAISRCAADHVSEATVSWFPCQMTR